MYEYFKLSLHSSLALVVTGSQDKTLLVHSLEQGMEGMAHGIVELIDSASQWGPDFSCCIY